MKLSVNRNRAAAFNPMLILVAAAITIGIGALMWEWRDAHPVAVKDNIPSHHHHHGKSHHGAGAGETASNEK